MKKEEIFKIIEDWHAGIGVDEEGLEYLAEMIEEAFNKKVRILDVNSMASGDEVTYSRITGGSKERYVESRREDALLEMIKYAYDIGLVEEKIVDRVNKRNGHRELKVAWKIRLIKQD